MTLSRNLKRNSGLDPKREITGVMEQNPLKKTKLISFRRFRSVVAVVVCGMMLASCGGGNADGSGSKSKNQTPKDITTEIYNCLFKGDVDKYVDKLVDYMSSEIKKSIKDEEAYKDMLKKQLKKSMGKDFEKFIEEHGDELRFEVEEEIDGDNALVSIKSPDGKSQKMKFVKEDGKWKIAE